MSKSSSLIQEKTGDHRCRQKKRIMAHNLVEKSSRRLEWTTEPETCRVVVGRCKVNRGLKQGKRLNGGWWAEGLTGTSMQNKIFW